MLFTVGYCVCGKDRCYHGKPSGGDVLTWTRWNGFDNFLELAGQTYPEIKWEYTPYAGSNSTGYSWAQMRADDIPDIYLHRGRIKE